METRKLYDTGLLRCTATVLACEKDGEGYLVVTDETVFFPEGGGQPSDRGTLGGAGVSHVFERGGAVFHRCDRGFREGERVELEVDRQIRRDHSQQHTGEHMISHAFWKLFGAVNIGFHMSGELVTIDLDLELDAAQCRAAEDYANAQIWEDKPVSAIYRSEDELHDLDLRKSTDKAEGPLRIVVIEDGDACACCGTHTETTGGVGLIKILRAERHRGGTRLELVCGRRALLDYREKTDALKSLVKEMSCGEDRLLESFTSLKNENRELMARLRSNSAKLMDYYARDAISAAKSSKDVRCVFTASEVTAGEAKQLLKRLLDGGEAVAGVFYPEGQRLNYIVGKTENAPLSCRDIARIANGLISGKGGGSDTLAQGSGKRTPDWRELVDMLSEAVLKMI